MKCALLRYKWHTVEFSHVNCILTNGSNDITTTTTTAMIWTYHHYPKSFLLFLYSQSSSPTFAFCHYSVPFLESHINQAVRCLLYLACHCASPTLMSSAGCPPALMWKAPRRCSWYICLFRDLLLCYVTCRKGCCSREAACVGFLVFIYWADCCLLYPYLSCLLILPRFLFYTTVMYPILREYFIHLSLINLALFTVLPGDFLKHFFKLTF